MHRSLGAGLLESAYQTALGVELAYQGVRFERQRVYPLEYRGAIVGEYRPDLIVENTVVVEKKCPPARTRLHRAAADIPTDYRAPGWADPELQPECVERWDKARRAVGRRTLQTENSLRVLRVLCG